MWLREYGSIRLIGILTIASQQMRIERLWTLLELNKLGHPRVMTSVPTTMLMQVHVPPSSESVAFVVIALAAILHFCKQ